MFLFHRSSSFSVRSLTLVFSPLFLLAFSSCSSQPISPEAASDKPQQETVRAHESASAALAEGKRNAQRAVKNAEATAEYHFSLAQAYVAEGNPDRAIEEYKLTLMFDPNSPIVYARLATEYVKKGMLSDAMETCKEALQRDPNFIDARLMLAGLYSSARDNKSALNEYNRVLKQDPRHEEAAVYKAQVLGESGKGGEATQFLKGFVKRNADAPLAWYYLGRSEQSADHFKEAVSAYRQSLKIRPNFGQAALSLGLLYEEKGMMAQAISIYKDIYDESQDLSAANRLATIYLKQEKYKDAIPFLQAIEAADPDDMNARVKLGLIYMEMKEYPKALAVFKAILDKNPDSDRIHYYVGSIYEETKQFEQAIAELKLIKPDSKLFPDATLHTAYLIKQAHSLADSKTFIQEAIARSPSVSSFYVYQATLEEEGKDLASAVAVLETAVKKFPEDEKVLYYLGSLYDRQGDSDKGVSSMEALLKVNPENADALNYIGYTWTTKGIRLGDAEKLLRKAVSLKPDNGYIQDSWGYYLFVRGRYSEAIVELEKAAKLKPNEPAILEHLADAYLSKNLREKAYAKYSDAVRLTDDTSAKQKIESKMTNLRRELAGSGKVGSGDRMPAGGQ